MAKIYSYVRNEVTKDNPSAQMSMRDFLDVACPVMNMVGVNDYLATFNWQLIPNGGDHYELKQYSQPLIQKATPTMTGFDLFCNCLANGYNVHNGQNILFGMIGRPENLMTTASFTTFPTLPQTTTAPEAPTSFKHDFLGMISQNPLFAASMVVQDMVGHSPEVHGVNVLRVRDINQVPDDMLRNRGSSTHYRQGSLSDLVRQYGDVSDTGEFEFGDEVMDMEPADNRSNAMPAKNTTVDFDVAAALSGNFLQRKYQKYDTIEVPILTKKKPLARTNSSRSCATTSNISICNFHGSRRTRPHWSR